MKKNLFILVLILIFSFSKNADALILDLSSITRDTVNGLDWLDLTESIGRPYNDVFSNLSIGGDFEGYRFATKGDIEGLLSQKGLVTATSPNFDNDAANVLEMINLLGITRESPHLTIQSVGLTAELGVPPFSSGYHQFSQIVLFLEDSTFPPPGSSLVNGYGYRLDDENNSESPIGSFLVRESPVVPEPATLLLLSSGLVGVFFRRKKS